MQGRKNMEAKLYYTAPTDEAFNEMKAASIQVWQGYENENYRNEKIGAIEKIQNVGDNFMYMFAMFDQDNQRKVVSQLSSATKDELRNRMIDGGNDSWEISMLGL